MTDRERLVEHIGTFCKGELGANLKKDILEKFADHILADGWVRTPCKVGSDIYTIKNGEIKKYYVMEVSKHNNGNNYIRYVPYGKNGIAELCWVQSRCTDKEIGKIVFLSREEAKKVLRGGEQDG